MGLNIKNPETEQLIRELAALRQTSLVEAVTVAVKEKLEQQRAEHDTAFDRKGRMAWVEELTNYTAPLLKDLPSSDKIGDLLYDKETGLPL